MDRVLAAAKILTLLDQSKPGQLPALIVNPIHPAGNLPAPEEVMWPAAAGIGLIGSCSIGSAVKLL